MPCLGLDALVKASRAVNIPTSDARDQNRKRLARRIAIGVAAGAGEPCASARRLSVKAPTDSVVTIQDADGIRRR
jgi:hypothetical protein